jgi:hypothetical protein
MLVHIQGVLGGNQIILKDPEEGARGIIGPTTVRIRETAGRAARQFRLPPDIYIRQIYE